jgi:hypothetical protein
MAPKTGSKKPVKQQGQQEKRHWSELFLFRRFAARQLFLELNSAISPWIGQDPINVLAARRQRSSSQVVET